MLAGTTKRSLAAAVIALALAASALVAAPAQADEAPGVYDIASDRSYYPTSGRMTLTWRAALPEGATTTGDASCTITIGMTDLTPIPCRSGEAFSYDVGFVFSTAHITITVQQFYSDPSDTVLLYPVSGSIGRTIDAVAPVVTVSALKAADATTAAPDPVGPGFAYTGDYTWAENTTYTTVTRTCWIERLSPDPLAVLAYVPCPGIDSYAGRATFSAPSGSGSYRLVVAAADSAGNVGRGTRAFTVDATPPTVTITSGPAAGGVSDGHPSWTWTSDDAAATYRCWFGAQGAVAVLSACTSPFTPAVAPEGPARLVIAATDALGNLSTTTRDVNVDATVPVLTGAGPAAPITALPASIAVSASEPIATWSCRTDAGSWSPCGSDSSTLELPLTASTTTNGEHTLVVRGVDVAGNLSAPLSVPYTVAVAATPVVASGPADGSLLNAAPSWSWTGSLDGSTFDCAFAPAGADPLFSPCSSPYSAPASVPDGSYAFVVRGSRPGFTDAVATRHVTLDRSAPELTVVSGPADGAVSTDAVASYAIASEPGATLECWWGGAGRAPEFRTCTSPYAVPLTSEGVRVVAFRATDAAGNTGAVVMRTVSAAPIAGTASVSGTARVGVPLTASGSWPADAALSYQWTRDGVAIRGAVSQSYTPVAADRKRRVAVVITGSRSGFASVSAASVSSVVAAGVLTSGKARVRATSMRVGKRVMASASTWRPGATVRYRWYLGRKAIAKATHSSIRLTKAMVGKKLTVKITGSRPGYETRVVSAVTSRVRR
ncbi:hypothetical protein QT381_01695 [Galbitalea sp. SE-J8]|uniref:hypothetical protein n=1 Tax=Galbitalea sp. SE-J8 TaxID=3054952 RepID=UPI00259D0D37|nr:hypothetical protein [Galbitalea sp. SE-J8]MDM4761716.1 hypothetical protein [Galbitalea sp. SE-J8]